MKWRGYFSPTLLKGGSDVHRGGGERGAGPGHPKSETTKNEML